MYGQYSGNTMHKSSKSELAMYYHQSMGSTPKLTFYAVIWKYPQLFSTFRGLTYDLVNNYLHLSTATLKGHIVQNLKRF
jgi:hypothetical protein